MRKTAIGMVLLLPLFASVAHAWDDDDAKLAKQCPVMAAWMKTYTAALAKQADAHDAFSEPALRTNLLSMAHNDQQARNAMIATGLKDKKASQAVANTDTANLKQLKSIVDKQGFPTVGQVGKRGVEAAFLLTQHADSDPEFQEHILAILKTRTGSEAVSGWDFALLTDRVLGKQGKLQLYGTQFNNKSGRWVPNPIEDPAHVDQRRAALGLPPLSDYTCMIKTMYGS